MSKAIVVIDMPSRCLNCNCVGYINHNGKFNVCRISGEILKEDDYYKQRPNHCPLREVPQKWDENKALTWKNKKFIDGRNACIDEIMKGAEENG